MPNQRSIASNLGLYVYAGGAIFLGVLGLVSADFATTWQNVGPAVPLRVPLAYLTAVLELAAGIALLLPRTARIGALTLTVIYSVFTLIWLPKAFVNLGNFDPIGNVFEEFSLVAAGLVLCATFSPAGSALARRRAFFVLLFGVCPISFGIVHIVDMPGLLGPIPGWLPPGKMFWAYATTIGFFAAAVSILTGIHGEACRPSPHRGDRDLRVAFLDSACPRRSPAITSLGRQRHQYRHRRRCLGRRRLPQRSRKNQANPIRIPCGRLARFPILHAPSPHQGREPTNLPRGNSERPPHRRHGNPSPVPCSLFPDPCFCCI